MNRRSAAAGLVLVLLGHSINANQATSFSLRDLCVLCVSAVSRWSEIRLTTEKQSTQRSRREEPKFTGIENAAALESFFKALADANFKRRLEPVRIMHFGDSHIAADVLTREIRERFQNEFGDGGPGFIIPRNPMATRRRGVISGATDGWVIEGIGGRYSSDAIYGPAGLNLATSDPGERAWLETTCNHFEVYFARQPDGGKIEVTVDGVEVLEEPIVLTSRVAKLDSVYIDLPDDAPHRLEIRTLSPGKVRLLGIVAERLAGGVSYDVFGINGAKANRILGWNQQALSAAVKARDPNLIILAYGTNEVADAGWTPASYEALLGEIIRRLHIAAPHASILVFAPPDRADLPLGRRLEALVNAERRAALANNAAFWSAFNAMGGAGSMNRWLRQGLAQSDRVHLTGAGYARLADLFYEDLKRARSEAISKTGQYESQIRNPFYANLPKSMNPADLFMEIVATYRKHGWELKAALMQPATRAELSRKEPDLLTPVAIKDATFDALWFSRPSHNNRVAWELRLLAETQYALFETFEADETEEQREEMRLEMEARLRDYIQGTDAGRGH